MRRVEIKELSLENFRTYGRFEDMLNPKTYRFGEEPVEFFRDMLQLNLGRATQVSFSINRISKRPLIITKTEFHSECGEGILALDGDILIHTGPATRPGVVPLDQFEVFRVPKGTMVLLMPGVWHHAPFAYNSNVVHILIVLPERTYANDCTVFELPEDDRIEIIEKNPT